MSPDLSRRKVTRVLIMLEYEPGDPDNGEVYDLTALARDFAPHSEHGGEVQVSVRFDKHDEINNGQWIAADFVSFRAGPCFHMSNSAGRLVDAINAAGIETERTERIVKSQKNLRKRLEKLDWQLKEAKLEAAASIRHQHPIARVTANPLADIPTPTLSAS